jgi:hypothetical protein
MHVKEKLLKYVRVYLSKIRVSAARHSICKTSKKTCTGGFETYKNSARNMKSFSFESAFC